MLRVVSYNIMDGGVGRADPIAEVLLAQQADVIGLQEAVDVSVLRRLSMRLSMDFVVAESELGAVALFSRHRIADSVNLSFVRKIKSPVLRATLSIERKPITIDVLDNRCPDVISVAEDSLPIARCVASDIAGVDIKRIGDPPRAVGQIWPGVDVNVQRHWIERDRLALYASDHLPVGAELLIG